MKKNGLYILKFSLIGTVFIVGWVRYLDNDECHLLPGNRRLVSRSGYWPAEAILELATSGPAENHYCDNPLGPLTAFHPLSVTAYIQANPEAWAKDCPRPADWVD